MMNTNVAAHIINKNAEARAKAKAEDRSFCGTSDEMATIIASDYATVYDYEFDMAKSDYSDCHKEIYGSRPYREFNSLEEVQKALQTFY